MDTNLQATPQSTLREIGELLNANQQGIVLVLDNKGCLLDTITDGDLRRAMLDGIPWNASVSTLKQRRTEALYTAEPISAKLGTDSGVLRQIMNDRSIGHIPLVDDDGVVVELITLHDLSNTDSEDRAVQGVIMAGGFGTRLRPLTENIPKPMLPVGDRPLLQYTIEQLRKAGIKNINITTHYMPEKIEEYFEDGEKFDVAINYVPEEKPLGTAGGLRLVEDIEEPLLVINGDILTKVDFRAMSDFHHKHQADMTVCVRKFDMQIPYGVIENDGVYVTSLQEKPEYSFMVNAGIYLLSPQARHMIPKEGRFDMTDLIEVIIADGGNVVMFPIIEYWLDIGLHDDYKRAQEDIQDWNG